MRRNAQIVYTLLFIFLVSISFLGNEVPRHHGLTLSLSYFAAFASYAWLSASEFHATRLLFISGLIARLSLLFSLPSLSDDFYRFLWDGQLIRSGINPYLHLPIEVPEGISENTRSLIPLMNSPEYFTIYPPFNQLIFWLAVSATDDVLMSVNAIRLLLIAADIGSFFLLRSLLGGKDQHLAFWFFLNPLVILEFAGNVHFEGLVIFFVLLALYFLKRNKGILSGSALGLAIATKLIPLIFLPYFGWHYRWKKGIVMVVTAIVLGGITLLPSLRGGFEGFSESIGLYFQRFEFNASFYYIFRELGYWQKGYNVIQTLGPELGRLSFIMILGAAFWGSYRKWGMEMTLMFTLTIYLGLATIVHPWYVTTLIPLGLLAGFRYPVVWSFGIFFTYLGYTESGYETPVIWIFLEYLVVYGVLIYEVRKKLYDKTSVA